MKDEIDVIADTFLEAVRTGDLDRLRSVYADDAIVWVNTDPFGNITHGTAERMDVKKLAGFAQRIPSARFEVWHRERTRSGYVEQHILRGRTADGHHLALPICVIVQIRGRKIVRMDEYILPMNPDDLARIHASHLAEQPRGA